MNKERMLDLAEIIEQNKLGMEYRQYDPYCCIAGHAVVAAYGNIERFKQLPRRDHTIVTEASRILGVKLGSHIYADLFAGGTTTREEAAAKLRKYGGSEIAQPTVA